MARTLVTAAVCVLGCAGGAGPAASSGETGRSPTAPAPASSPSPPPATAPPLSFVDAPPLPEGGAAFSIRFPENGANLPAATARDARLEIAVDASLLASVEVSLDGARSRPVAILPDPPKLSDLGDLAAGDHYLVATLRSAPNLPARHAVVRFGVGGEPSQHPLVFCNRPEGTVYSAAGAKLLLDFVTDGFRPGEDGSVRVQIQDARTGKVRFESLLATSAAREFMLPGFDDFAVELALLDSRGQVLKGKFARDRCDVTRNEVVP